MLDKWGGRWGKWIGHIELPSSRSEAHIFNFNLSITLQPHQPLPFPASSRELSKELIKRAEPLRERDPLHVWRTMYFTDFASSWCHVGHLGGRDSAPWWPWLLACRNHCQCVHAHHSAVFKMDNQYGPPVQHRELCSMSSGSLDGRGVWGETDTCICLAEALWCLLETITTLLIGYTPMQNKKFF